MTPQSDAGNTMDEACKQLRSFKENGKKDDYIQNQKQTDEIYLTHIEGELGEFGAHRTYRSQKREGKAVGHLPGRLV